MYFCFCHDMRWCIGTLNSFAFIFATRGRSGTNVLVTSRVVASRCLTSRRHGTSPFETYVWHAVLGQQVIDQQAEMKFCLPCEAFEFIVSSEKNDFHMKRGQQVSDQQAAWKTSFEYMDVI